MCVPAELVRSLGLDQGFNARPHDQMRALISPDRISYQPRGPAESDESVRQLISYIIFVHRGDVLVYRRLKKSGERRLHGNYSIGFGGHINDGDSGYEAAVDREAREELQFPVGRPVMEYRGFVLDDSNAVGRVHLGIVHVAHIPMRAFNPISNEPDSVEITNFYHPDHLSDFLMDKKKWPFEQWSHYCIQALPEILKSHARDHLGREPVE